MRRMIYALPPGNRRASPIEAAPRRRIAVVALDEPGGLGGSLVRGLAACEGTDVRWVRYPNWLPRFRLPLPRGAGRAAYEMSRAVRPAAELRLLRELRRLDPALVLLIKCDDLHRWFYRALRRGSRAALVCFHPDDPFNRGTLLAPGPGHRRAALQFEFADLYLAWGESIARRVAAHSRCAVQYLPFAYDPAIHAGNVPAGEGRADLGAEATFIGNWDPEREPWLAEAIRAGIDLSIWGESTWLTHSREPRLREAYRGRPLRGAEWAAAVRASKVNLNLLRAQNEGACNMRTFEIPGAGGFMLHQRSPALPQLFPPGVACDDFGSPAEMVDKIRRYLADDDAREALARAGRERALGMTYRHRAAALLAHAEALGLMDRAAGSGSVPRAGA